MSLLQIEVADLDIAPQVTAKDIAQVKAEKKRVQDLLGGLDA